MRRVDRFCHGVPHDPREGFPCRRHDPGYGSGHADQLDLDCIYSAGVKLRKLESE